MHPTLPPLPVDTHDSVFQFDVFEEPPTDLPPSVTTEPQASPATIDAANGASTMPPSSSQSQAKGKGVSAPVSIPSTSMKTLDTLRSAPPSPHLAPSHKHSNTTFTSQASSSSMAASEYLRNAKGKGKLPDSPPCLPPLPFSEQDTFDLYAHISWPSPSSFTESVGSSSTSFGSPLFAIGSLPSASVPPDHLKPIDDASNGGIPGPTRQRTVSDSSGRSLRTIRLGLGRNPGNLSRKLLSSKGQGSSAASYDVASVPTTSTFHTTFDSQASLRDVSYTYRFSDILDANLDGASWPAGPKGKQRSYSSPMPYSPLDVALRHASYDTHAPPPSPPPVVYSPFDHIPKEICIKMFASVLYLHEAEYLKAVDDGSWTTSRASSSKNRWVGRDKGIRELVKFSRVSKSWQLLVCDGQLWKDLDLRAFHSIPKTIILRLTSVSGPFVRSLNIAGHVFMLSPSFAEIGRRLCMPVPAGLETRSTTQLSSLNVAGCSMLSTHSLHGVLRCSPNLQSLNIKGLTIVTNSTFDVLAEHCQRLCVLDAGRCPNINADGVRAFAEAARRRGEFLPLKILRLSGLKYVDDSMMATLGKVTPHLEVLDLSYARQLHNSSVEVFVACDDRDTEESLGVQIVTISARQAGRDTGYDTEYRRRLTNLRHINLSFCILLTDQVCANLAHSVPGLEFLELAGIGDDLKEQGLIRLFETTPRIRRLDLEDASELTDAVLSSLTPEPRPEKASASVTRQTGEMLEHLVVSYASDLTDAGLLPLIRNCHRLKVLEADNTRLTARAFKEFVRLSRSRKLENARVGAIDCRSIGESTIKELKSMTRPRCGWRAFEARKLKYLDARDGDLDDLKIGQDECDEKRVVVKTFYSWQTVDAVRSAREKRKKATSRRTTNSTDSSNEDGVTPSRWWSGGRRSGTASPIEMNNRDSCNIM
ncbi:RNI-like protein [Cylindrobasidium torrendii FP15055 ss-10]|uniref:RNI-like protein n=1 Tax=Cylindrobasidium torrendii FP15055 ss-10 TaxID=1314674 RepID=A0A0D7BV68_9AGAR|nr:RNI-like protein [Cylindrobasidium torrendii FP15055 ss-10]